MSEAIGVEGIIRDANPERDAAGCLAIYAPFITGTVVSFEETVPTVDEFRDRITSTTKTHPWLVMEIDGSLAGYAYASAHRQRAAYRWSADVAIYVDPAHHRKGVGRRLYTELLGLLRRQGIRVVCAGITIPNESSVGLHMAMGFEPVGVYKRIGWKAGAWHDVMWLELELAPAAGEQPPEPRPPR